MWWKLFVWSLTRIWFASLMVDVFVAPGGPSIWIIRRRRCKHRVQAYGFPWCRWVFFKIRPVCLLARPIPALPSFFQRRRRLLRFLLCRALQTLRKSRLIRWFGRLLRLVPLSVMTRCAWCLVIQWWPLNRQATSSRLRCLLVPAASIRVRWLRSV